MSDRLVVAAAVAAALGAWWAAPVPPAVGALLTGAAWVLGTALPSARGGAALRIVAVVGLALLVAGLAHRSLAGLEAPGAGERRGVAQLVGDPRPVRGGVAAVVRLDGRRWEALAWGSPAGAVGRARAGDRLAVRGTSDGRPAPAWLRNRHIVGRLTLVAAEPVGPPPPLALAANRAHALLARGAEPLGARAPLLLGLVLGDDRDQSPEARAAFRAAGLSHLTAVSGQNVAFVLGVASPALLALDRRARTVATLGVLGAFVVLTRAEPSVLRAAAMAGFAVVHAHRGQQRTGLRRLAATVVLLLVVDPLLVRSLGLWLSVSATAGIVLLSPALADRLPGPRPAATALGVTLGAQLATAPLLVAAFGAVPVVALPANLLAVPVAGALMVWGLTGGMAAGVLGGRAAALLHAPTAAGLWWLEAVAGRAAGAPVGSLGAVHVAVLGLAAGVGLAPRAGPAQRRAAAALAVATLVVAGLWGPAGAVAGAG